MMDIWTRRKLTLSRERRLSGVLAALICIVSAVSCGAAPVKGWLSWRGPEQTGVSREIGLPSKVSAQDALWVADYPGQSAPVIANRSEEHTSELQSLRHL